MTAGADLRVVTPSPLCAETPLERQRDLLTPNELFYVRDHFAVPERWSGLVVEGSNSRLELSVEDLARGDRRSFVATLECAGNGRSYLEPPVAGEPWGLGAVSTAEWSGTPLAGVLADAGIAASAVEVVFWGGDAYARSLPIEVATHPDTLLVTAMNGQPLPIEHGGPLRLVVPRWYAMASVKWLNRITFVEQPFDGRFQVDSYVIDHAPVREMEVRAVITEPADGATTSGSVQVRGFAWSGRGEVTSVEISDDGGASWQEARLADAAPPYGWTRWELEWVPAGTGPMSLLARASDSAGHVQPLEQRWTERGYCNNGAVPTNVNVVALR